MKQINFHLALYPDTFLWINEQKGIFYNTREHSTFLFDITNLIKIIVRNCLTSTTYM